MLNEVKSSLSCIIRVRISGKKLSLVFGVMLILGLAMSTSLMADGIEPTGNPRQVSTLDHLLWISTTSSSWGDDFIQTADIDASGTNSWNSGAGFSPIGNSNTEFTGSYDGQGYTIDGLTINRGSDNIGLFGRADGNGATISNLGVTNVNITGNSYVGGLAGRIQNSATVEGCFSTGSVSGDNDNGGLVGMNYINSEVSNCYSRATVSGGNNTGGLVGYNYTPATISNSYSTGSVSGSSGIGGLVGTNSATVSNSFWDTQTSNQSSGAGTGKTTAEMKTQGTFTGWDFITTPIWDRVDNQNGGYPHLHWQTFPRTVTFTDGSSYSPSPTQGETNQAIGCFALHGDESGATFNGVWITLNGTRTGATNFKLWYSSDATFNSGSDTQLGSTVATDPGDGNDVWFTGFVNDIETSDGYYFLSCDVAADATGSIQGVIVNDEDMMLGFSTSSTSSENLSSGDASLPVELSSFTAENRSGGVLLKWTTESEIENLGFILERRDSKFETGNWEEIAGYITDSRLQGQGSVTHRTEYSYTDNAVTPGMTYEYRLSDVSYAGVVEQHGTCEIFVRATEESTLPEKFGLTSVYPNPFNPETYIAFNLCDDAEISVCILDLLGRKVCNIVSEKRPVGSYTVIWDGRDNSGVRLSSGVYFVLMESGNMRSSRKLVLFR